MLGGDTESHQNSGFWLLNATAKDHYSAGTVVVAGLGRSGTSMLAAVLKTAGICMGEQTAIGTHEDQQLATLLQPRKRRELRRLIEQRNQNYTLWGFKLPSRQILEPSLFSLLRRPYLVVIFRDILAIAGRRQISKGESLQCQLTQSLSEYRRLVRFLDRIDHPCLLISYEKALLDPDLLVDQLDHFLRLNLDNISKVACSASVQVSPDIYRREVRQLQGWQGRLEEIQKDKIKGWAYVGQADAPAKVEIWINGLRQYFCIANRPRPDVQSEHQLKTSACGFCIALNGDSQLLKQGDYVSARLAETEQQLRNSPLTYTDP
ncbi:hypothetical protein KBY95_12395 [Cyanobium sp. Aljojuca 7A6]|nr:hypothetical protein [Cyanobium sp. La Preciosa 7G6]MCP9937880.1 hypothetical protein [Cyanobium sp. Aljojuca 7A6]